jgi:glutamate/tyrosine decarboxylase-like PLP-dependent enzyme
VSADAHYSMEKAANVLGLGTDSLIKIPVNYRGEMDMTILAEQLAKAQKRSSIPFFVSGTAGTTVRGAYDPIEPLLALRDRYGFWLHMDGAWGGAGFAAAGMTAIFSTPQTTTVCGIWARSPCSAAAGWTA